MTYEDQVLNNFHRTLKKGCLVRFPLSKEPDKIFLVIKLLVSAFKENYILYVMCDSCLQKREAYYKNIEIIENL